MNYHYLTVEGDRHQKNVTMNRLELGGTKSVWTQPDSVKMDAPNALSEHAEAGD